MAQHQKPNREIYIFAALENRAIHIVYLQLGTNIGNRFKNLSKAIELIEERVGRVQQSSGIYETDAWGKTDQAAFLNQAIEVHTQLWPLDLLTIIKDIEKEAGRKKHERWGPRELDVDVIFYDDLHFALKNLVVPHPRMHIRNFVLIPLMDICPDYLHPVFKQTTRELKAWCQDDLGVRKIKK